MGATNGSIAQRWAGEESCSCRVSFAMLSGAINRFTKSACERYWGQTVEHYIAQVLEPHVDARVSCDAANTRVGARDAVLTRRTKDYIDRTFDVNLDIDKSLVSRIHFRILSLRPSTAGGAEVTVTCEYSNDDPSLLTMSFMLSTAA